MRHNTIQYMRSLVEAAERCEDLEMVEKEVVGSLTKWFKTYPGWGLLSR